MRDFIVQTDRIVLLIGAGQVDGPSFDRLQNKGALPIAADGGADTLLAAGVVPDWVIGDLDSISPAARAMLAPDRLIRVDEQDSTDFEKCLRRIRAPLIVGLGMLGPRLDHQLSALSVLARFGDQPCILVGDKDIVFAWRDDLRLDLAAGTRVSLFPMRALRAQSQGLVWPLDGLDLAPDRVVSSSNAATGGAVVLQGAAGMIAVLPKTALDAVSAALAVPPAPGG